MESWIPIETAEDAKVKVAKAELEDSENRYWKRGVINVILVLPEMFNLSKG